MTATTNEFLAQLDRLVEHAHAQFTDAIGGVLVVFTPDGAMHAQWSCSPTHLAMVAARLSFEAAIATTAPPKEQLAAPKKKSA